MRVELKFFARKRNLEHQCVTHCLNIFFANQKLNASLYMRLGLSRFYVCDTGEARGKKKRKEGELIRLCVFLAARSSLSSVRPARELCASSSFLFSFFLDRAFFFLLLSRGIEINKITSPLPARMQTAYPPLLFFLFLSPLNEKAGIEEGKRRVFPR